MKYYLLVFILLLAMRNLYGQNLPTKKLVQHLLSVGEINPDNSFSEEMDQVYVDKFFCVDGKGLYRFMPDYDHHYTYLLMKDNDSFRILNCYSFIHDYEIMERLFTGASKDSFYHYIIPIIRVYEHNYNFHPTPPIINLKTNEISYPPRRLIKTKPFYFVPGLDDSAKTLER